MRFVFAWLVAATLGISVTQAQPPAPEPDKLGQIEHIVVIFMENRSFDSLFGNFPGANGIAYAGPATTQIDDDDVPYKVLPQPLNLRVKPKAPDARFPADLANGPFAIDVYARRDTLLPSPIHAFYHEQAQINGGAMNRFVAATDVAGAVMGYHDMRNSQIWKLATEFTLGDNYFHSAFGGSFLNHAFLACACAFAFPNAPAAIVAQVDAQGRMLKNGNVTPDGYAVNTLRSVYLHHPDDDAHPEMLVPPQTVPHIGDRLDAAQVSWKWYSGGYARAMARTPDKNFQFHHQPLAYFADLAPGTDAQKAHLQDYTDFIHDIEANTLPQVVFYKPLGDFNMHPSYALLADGDAHLGELVAKLRASPAYAKMLIIVTFDENGGFWDHVSPPRRDRFGPGSRVPMIAIGPMVKRGFVDHTAYEHLSILRTIELRFGAAPVNATDANAYPLSNVLQ